MERRGRWIEDEDGAKMKKERRRTRWFEGEDVEKTKL
jgi:hypothetical protein